MPLLSKTVVMVAVETVLSLATRSEDDIDDPSVLRKPKVGYHSGAGAQVERPPASLDGPPTAEKDRRALSLPPMRAARRSRHPSPGWS